MSYLNVDTPIYNLSLCSGGAGLDLGLELVLPTLRTVCWVEWEAFAIDFLATCMETGRLHPAPVWTDLRTFNGKPWRGVVDCLTAGYPCQPFSNAGKRGGADDPRHLWPQVQRIIGEVEPGIVLLENVSGHTSLGAEQVVADLQELGYETAAALFTAAEVGASHKRERFFILGLANASIASVRISTASWADDAIRALVTSPSEDMDDTAWDERRGSHRQAWSGWRVCEAMHELADATGARCTGRQDTATDCNYAGEDESWRKEPERSSACVAHSECEGLEEWSCERSDIGSQFQTAERSCLPLFPPGPDDVDRWGGRPQRSPARRTRN